MHTNERAKIINDPIYGFIDIDKGIINDLINHEYFQRLRRISQLGLSYLVYPGAQHTRFQHALGCLFLMKKALLQLENKGHIITKEEKELRSKALHILSNEKRHQFYNQFENTVRPVLIEKSNNIITQGFTDNYIKVHIEENISIQNTIVSVLLKKNNGSYMEGEII